MTIYYCLAGEIKMNKSYKYILMTILAILTLCTIILFLNGAGPRVTALLLLMTLVFLGLLLPKEYIIITAIFLIPLAPHTKLFSENLPAMTIELPFAAVYGIMFLYPAMKRAGQLKGLWLLVGCWGIFSILVVLSWMHAGSKNANELFAVNHFAFLGALLVMAAAVYTNDFDFKKVCRAFYTVAFVVALIGLFQYLFFPHFINDLYINAYMKSGMDSGYYGRIYDRALSTFGNPHTLGLFLGIILMFATGSNFWGFTNRWTKYAWIVTLLSVIILTRSRTTFICLVLGYLFLICFRRYELKKIIYTLGTLAAIFGIINHYLRDNWIDKLLNYDMSLHARFVRWDMALDRFMSSPVFGVGPNPNIRIGNDMSSVPIDNIYFTVLASYGLLGTAALALTLFIIFYQLIKLANFDSRSKNIALGLGCSLLMLLIGNLSGDFLFHPKVMGPYMLLLGCFMVAGQIKTGGPTKILIVGNAKSIHIQRWGTSLAQKGLSVHVLSPEAHVVEGCSVHVIKGASLPVLSPAGMLSFVSRLLQVEKKIKVVDPDLVHIHGAFSFGWFAASCKGSPVITSTWGSDIYRYAGASRLKYKVVKSILKRSDVVTVHNRQMADYVEEKFGVSKCFVLPWGIEDRVFRLEDHKGAANIREALQVPEANKIVLSPRGMTPLYNIEVIIEAIPLVLRFDKHVTFCFVRGAGSAAYEARMMQRALKLKVNDHIRWIKKFQTSEQMADLYRASNIFISIPETDSSALTIAEGLACGSIPVLKKLITYRCFYETGAVIYTVSDLTPANLAAVVNEALKKDAREIRAINAAAAASLGTWRNAVSRMVELYESIHAGRQVKGVRQVE
jgi:glycosyltransferase involved in cell wall biosynthesis/O-antigen ligase